MTHLFSCTLHQATIDNEVAVLIKLKEQYQKLTGESLGGGDKKKGKDKPKAKKQPEEGKGAAKGAGKDESYCFFFRGQRGTFPHLLGRSLSSGWRSSAITEEDNQVCHLVCRRVFVDRSLSSLGWGWRHFQNGIVRDVSGCYILRGPSVSGTGSRVCLTICCFN